MKNFYLAFGCGCALRVSQSVSSARERCSVEKLM